jgi:DMSO/TMAO reductase YedYZ molybdopterin-dependent catalytic subunit
MAGLAAFGIPEWMLPALAQGEEVVAWGDVPANFNPNPANGNRTLDTRILDRSRFITPTEEFFAVQHYGQPQVDLATYKLRITGLVNKPIELSLDELKRRPRLEHVVGFECAGSSPNRMNNLTGNARWAGTSLSALLQEAGPKANVKEIVFFGADKFMEDLTHGGGQFPQVEQNFGRSLALEDAMRPEVMIAWEMNGAPLPPNHGAPVRMIVPGWYGVANVKWLDHIHAQDTRFMGRFMAREYVTLMGRKIGDQTIWTETSVGRIRIKSMVARLTRNGNRYTATGFALHDATPLRSVEVKVDNGAWQAATLATENTPHSWKLFTYSWTGLTPGEHTIVSRATDANGVVQPEPAELELKRTRWEHYAQFARKFTV